MIPRLIAALTALVLSTQILVDEAHADEAYEAQCLEFMDYQFGNRMQRLIQQHGAEEVDRRLGLMCSCYMDVMSDAGLSVSEATQTLDRVVQEDAFFANPMPQWFEDFDKKTRTGFDTCNRKSAQPASAVPEPVDPNDITELVRLGCEKDAARSGAYCACLGEEVNALAQGFAHDGAHKMLALLAGGDRAMDPADMADVAINSTQEAKTEATFAAMTRMGAITAQCDAVALKAAASDPPQTPTDMADATGRDKFISVCNAAGDGVQANCECAADVMLTKLTEGELGLMAAMQAAQSQGMNPVDAFMEIGGLTRSEAQAAIPELAGRMIMVQELGPQLAECGMQ